MRFALTNGALNSVNVFDLRTETRLGTFELADPEFPPGGIRSCPVDSQFDPGAVTFSRDGKRVAATNLQGPVVLDLETGQASTIHRRAGDLRGLAFNADDSWLAAARGNFIELWEMKSPKNPIVLSGRCRWSSPWRFIPRRPCWPRDQSMAASGCGT